MATGRRARFGDHLVSDHGNVDVSRGVALPQCPLIGAAFEWTSRKCPVASSWPEARASEAVGDANITKKTSAIAEGFMRGSFTKSHQQAGYVKAM
jgi:hypothetical protein